MDERLRTILDEKLAEISDNPHRQEQADEKRKWTWEELVEYESSLETVALIAELLKGNRNKIWEIYDFLKFAVSHLVGWSSGLRCLRTSNAYEAAMCKISDTLEV